MRHHAAILWMLLISVALGGAAHAADFDRFLGSYQGEVNTTIDGDEVKRDLSVEIAEIDDGFRVKWTTTTIQPDGREKSKSYSIDFIPTDREHIFRSAMKKNLFGGREPLDPMKGDPYVWADINGDTLTVHALIVTEDGGYEMQTYDRTLVEGGLDLRFNRIRNGESLREIQATLRRVN